MNIFIAPFLRGSPEFCREDANKRGFLCICQKRLLISAPMNVPPVLICVEEAGVELWMVAGFQGPNLLVWQGLLTSSGTLSSTTIKGLVLLHLFSNQWISVYWKPCMANTQCSLGFTSISQASCILSYPQFLMDSSYKKLCWSFLTLRQSISPWDCLTCSFHLPRDI